MNKQVPVKKTTTTNGCINGHSIAKPKKKKKNINRQEHDSTKKHTVQS